MATKAATFWAASSVMPNRLCAIRVQVTNPGGLANEKMLVFVFRELGALFVRDSTWSKLYEETQTESNQGPTGGVGARRGRCVDRHTSIGPGDNIVCRWIAAALNNVEKPASDLNIDISIAYELKSCIAELGFLDPNVVVGNEGMGRHGGFILSQPGKVSSWELEARHRMV